MCGCQGRCGKCLPAVLLEWTGDRDFTSVLDIRNYAGYFSELTERQPPNSAVVWRIRNNPDQDFLEYLTDTKTLVAGSELNGTAFINYMPFTNAAAIHSGPVRDGIMYGLDMVPAGRAAANIYRWPGPLPFVQQDPLTAAVDHNFVGTADLKSYNTNGNPFPANWTVQDHPDNPIAIPWALEIGCARCGCLDSITWPAHADWHYDPWVPYGGVGGGLTATDPDNSTLVSPNVAGCCQDITPDDLESVYWPGDSAEPDHSPVCPPDCIVWLSDMLAMGDPRLISGGGVRSIPGKSLPLDADDHPALQLATSIGSVVQLTGWTGLSNGTSAARSATGSDAAISNVDCIWLVNPYYTAQGMGDFTRSWNMAAGDVQWLIDWLALGGKTLIVDTPWKHTSNPPTWSNPPGNLNWRPEFGNEFLGFLGSSLSLYDIDDDLRVVYQLDCESTELHPLAPDPELIFSGNLALPANYVQINNGTLTLPPMGLTGGTTIYEHNCVMRATDLSGNPGELTNETHPCIAIEDMGNGSNLITGSISIEGQSGAASGVGLANVPGIGNMIARIPAAL